MSAAATALAAIQGQREAEEVLRAIQAGAAAPDAIYEALRRLRGGSEPAMRAFARQLQKALEGR